jgi:hypothetical protein
VNSQISSTVIERKVEICLHDQEQIVRYSEVEPVHENIVEYDARDECGRN